MVIGWLAISFILWLHQKCNKYKIIINVNVHTSLPNNSCLWHADVCICIIGLIIFANVPFLHFIISFRSLATWMHSSTLVVLQVTFLYFPSILGTTSLKFRPKMNAIYFCLIIRDHLASAGFLWQSLIKHLMKSWLGHTKHDIWETSSVIWVFI